MSGAIDLWRIGHAASSNGQVGSQSPDPVFVTTESWDGTKVSRNVVVRIWDGNGMWFTSPLTSPAPADVGYAVSPDGLDWFQRQRTTQGELP